MSSIPGPSHESHLHFHFLDRLTNLMDEDPNKNAAEVSKIMLWIATCHPEALKDDSDQLQGLSIHYLYFPESWENPDEFIPTVPLTILLRSKVCEDLQTLSGYVNPRVLSNIHNPLYIKRLSLGKNTDVKFLMAELERRRRRDTQKYHDRNLHEGTAIHLRCGEINVKDLATIPDIHPWLYISDVSDRGADWVVKATAALQTKAGRRAALLPKGAPRSVLYIGILHLPRSKLTLAGIEAIAKGFFNSGQQFDLLDVSSPYINLDNDSKNAYCSMIQEKYNLGCLTFGGEEEMQFTEILDDISRQTNFDFDGIDGSEAFCNTTENDGVPLGSVLCPVWVK